MLQEPLVYLVIMVLLPLIPAYVLYKTLPSSADVSGPLQGLTIKLGGAFAGYFALVLLIFVFGPKPPEPTKVEVWTVEGKTGFTAAPGSAPPADNIVLTQDPPRLNLGSAGHFTMEILVKEGEGGVMDFRKLHSAHPGYSPVSVDLSGDPPRWGERDHKVTHDKRARKIIIGEPILLQREPQQKPKEG